MGLDNRGRQYISNSFDDLLRLVGLLKDQTTSWIEDMVEVIAAAFRGHHRLFVFGNGGSAADAQHFAAELVNRFELKRPPLPAIALTTDTSILTSISNDDNFDMVFVRQLSALAEQGDVAFGISTSGKSPNVVKALRWAREHGLHTFGLSGKDTTEMDVYCDRIIHVPSDSTPRIQECHILLIHIICGLIERKLFMDRTHGMDTTEP
ncbi:MAG: D-sedoheptulose 7-phosphate isomerase [Deltaproteobacteria bacterium]|nr:D-sedoheptulose 7-phosphate isomerase [Deltaproteobacteria bacterium]MBW2067391.1 D-sedoheptulose 7-phosphate isomerase [Deltaproteobacteria bacterium]